MLSRYDFDIDTNVRTVRLLCGVMPPSSFGGVMRQHRLDKKLTLRQLAKAVGVTPTFLSDIELGRRLPSRDVLDRLAGALRVSCTEIRCHDGRLALRDLKRLCVEEPTMLSALCILTQRINSGEVRVEDAARTIASVQFI